MVGAFLALGAAALFGISAPLAKQLLHEVPVLLLSGLLYLGAAIGLTVTAVFGFAGDRDAETPLRRRDVGLLLAIALVGGVLGPVLLLLGLQRVSAVTASLLLNFETPFTILLAVVLFGDFIGGRERRPTALSVGRRFSPPFLPGGSPPAQFSGIVRR